MDERIYEKISQWFTLIIANGLIIKGRAVINIQELPSRIEPLSAEDKVLFYEFLAHEITVGMRLIWSDKDISLKDQNVQMKWLNEVQHHVVNKLRSERRKSQKMSDTVFVDTLQECIKNCPAIDNIITSALESSYDSLQRTQ